jgi:sugar phosphate isomerase/epimerase
MSGFKLGIQLYSVREPLAEDFKGTLEMLAEMGIKGVELAFYYGDMEPADLAELMKELDLEVCGIYEHFPNLSDESAKVYDYAKALGCEYLTSGLSLDNLKNDFASCVETARKACSVAAENDMTICYHAHAHEFEKVDGEYILDNLLNAVPEMNFEADTAWIKCGGESVVGYMEKWASRIPLVHVKDVKGADEDKRITELGNGVIDFKEVLEFAERNDVEWVSYEQDYTDVGASPLDSAKISLDYLKSL